jgi:hypothetical protein
MQLEAGGMKANGGLGLLLLGRDVPLARGWPRYPLAQSLIFSYK